MSGRLDAPFKPDSVKTVDSTALTKQINDLQKSDPELFKALIKNMKPTADLVPLALYDSGTKKTSDQSTKPWQEQRKEAEKTQKQEIDKNGSRKIQKGDTLWDIARNSLELKNSKEKPNHKEIWEEVKRLAKINGISSYDKVPLGKELKMQSPDATKEKTETKRPSTPSDTKPKDGDRDKLQRKIDFPEKESVEYDEKGRVKKILKDDKERYKVEYDSTGKITRLDAPNGVNWRLGNDGKYQLHVGDKPSGAPVEMDINITKDGTVEYKYKDGRTFRHYRDGSRTESDKDGNVVEIAYPSGDSYEIKYSQGKPTEIKVKKPDNSTSTTLKLEDGSWKQYDDKGKLTREWQSIKVGKDGRLEWQHQAGQYITDRHGKHLTPKEQKEKEEKYREDFLKLQRKK